MRPAAAEIHHLGVGSSRSRSGVHQHEHANENHGSQDNRKNDGQEIILLGYVLRGIDDSVPVQQLLCCNDVRNIHDFGLFRRSVAYNQHDLAGGRLLVLLNSRCDYAAILDGLHIFLVTDLLILSRKHACYDQHDHKDQNET